MSQSNNYQVFENVIRAVKSSHADIMADTIRDMGVDGDFSLLLQLAITSNDAQLACFAVSLGATMVPGISKLNGFHSIKNRQLENGSTLLHAAIDAGKPDIVSELIQAGVNRDMTDAQGYQAALYATMQYATGNIDSATNNAIYEVLINTPSPHALELDDLSSAEAEVVETNPRLLNPTLVERNQSYEETASKLYEAHFGDNKPGASNDMYKQLRTFSDDRSEQLNVLTKLEELVKSNEGEKYQQGYKRAKFGLSNKDALKNRNGHLKSIERLRGHITTKQAEARQQLNANV